MFSLINTLFYAVIINAGVGLFVIEGNERDRQERISECRDSVEYVFDDNYTIIYDECREQPLRASYTIYPNTKKIVTRKKDGGRFFISKDLWTSDNRDYRNNKYDRGHLLSASARDFDRQKYRETFHFSNVALQVDKLNRGIWHDLEVEIQDLSDALGIEINVVIDVIFTSDSERLKTGAVVPDAFRKIYLDKCFIFANVDNSKRLECQQ